MTTAADSYTPGAMEREIVIIRTFNAPRKLVFQAWTDPKMLAHWWGPRNYTATIPEIDLRVGGKFRIVMHAPNGVDIHPMTASFTEYDEPERLAFTFNAVDDQETALLEGLTSVLFEEESGKTKMTLTSRGVGLQPIAARMLEGMQAGWSQSIDKFEEFLASL